MHITEAVLALVRARYGQPAHMRWEGEVSPEELALAAASPTRRHDVTLFLFHGERLALIRKPHFPAGVWRPPGGGIKPGEPFVEGVLREALEETGATVELHRYLVVAHATFRCRHRRLDWRTHVFSAFTDTDELAPRDRAEIAAARWGSADELAGPIRERLLATGRALWRYRVALHDAALAALDGRSPSR